MNTASEAQSMRRLTHFVCGCLIVAGFAALYPIQRSIDRAREAAAGVEDVLYVPSGGPLRRLSMGYEGLLSNIYWTRVVQYFGRQRLAHDTRFELLGPLLRVTTELDPNLLIAYRFGAVFLAEKPPGGAGKPEEALQLLRRGIVANPDYWRFWQDLGFIYYWDLKDYAAAARAFQVGSERPGAMLWMKAMAANVAAKGGSLETSRSLWLEIYRHADSDSIRGSAIEHLRALDAQAQMERLNGLLSEFHARKGRAATSFGELVRAGLLRSMPRDPSGVMYVIGKDGRAHLSNESRVDLRLLQ